MLKRLSAIVTALLFVVLVPISAIPAYAKGDILLCWTVPEGYNENDYNKIAAFLEQTNEWGLVNGEMMNDNGYDVNDPSTWGVNYIDGSPAFQWEMVDGEMRIVSINCGDHFVGGSLDLSGCDKLTELLCYYCMIDQVNVSGCSSLTVLNCNGNNRIYDLNVSECPLLVELQCGFNLLYSLNLSNNPNLVTVVCSYNQIVALDFSNNTELEHISCDNCGAYFIDVSKCEKLKTLSCEYNNLFAVDVSANSLLEMLICQSNNMPAIDVTNNTLLDTLICFGNPIRELDVSNNPALSWFICGWGSYLRELDLSKNPLLQPDLISAEGDGYIGYSQDESGQHFCLAYPEEGWLFDGWYDDNGTCLSNYPELWINTLDVISYTARFIPDSVAIQGDANGDGTVDTEDALLVLRAALGITGDPAALLANCDMDGSGVIDTTDALLILRLALGITA